MIDEDKATQRSNLLALTRDDTLSAMAWNVNGKYIVVTGANGGIGYETAKQLYNMGARVIMVCRNETRGEQALASIRKSTPSTGDSGLYLVIGDMAEAESVSRAAEATSSITTHIDILINNAGAYFGQRRENSAGVEYTFALNHLGYFRLTASLMPMLQAAGEARIVSVSSEAHRFTDIRWDDIFFESRRYKGFAAYGQSKLMNILFTRELARRLASDSASITANCLHPGFIKTGFANLKPDEGGSSGFSLMAKLFAKPPEAGAKTGVYLASSPEPSEANGLYFKNSRRAKPSASARDDAAATRLWELSERFA